MMNKRFKSLKQGIGTLKRRSEDFGEKANGSESLTEGLESPSANLKQNVEKRKGFKSPQRGFESIIWENEEQSQRSKSLQE